MNIAPTLPLQYGFGPRPVSETDTSYFYECDTYEKNYTLSVPKNGGLFKLTMDGGNDGSYSKYISEEGESLEHFLEYNMDTIDPEDIG